MRGIYLFLDGIRNSLYSFLGFIAKVSNKIPRQTRLIVKNIVRGFLICFIALPIITSIIQYDKMPSNSMIGAIDKGKGMFIFKLYYGISIGPFVSKITGKTIIFNRPKRGDVVLIKYPPNVEESTLKNISSYILYYFSFGKIDIYKEKHIVKRIIALSTETIEIRDKVIYINGIPIDEKWNSLHTDQRILDKIISNRDNFGPYVVPYNKYFVLSDNRDYAYDSRDFGSMDFGVIKGKVLGIK